MKQGAKAGVWFLGITALTVVACVVLVKLDVKCLPAQLYAPDMPGDQPNPKLVVMFNEVIDGLDKAQLNSTYYSGLIPAAAANARLGFAEVREVVTHCRYGASNKFNNFQYDLTLQTGEVFKNLTATTARCDDEYQTAMRVTFEGGRVVQVTTDGSEMTRPLDQARGAAARTVEALISRDQDLHPERYYWPKPVQPTPAQEWAQP